MTRNDVSDINEFLAWTRADQARILADVAAMFPDDVYLRDAATHAAERPPTLMEGVLSHLDEAWTRAGKEPLSPYGDAWRKVLRTLVG